MIRTLLIVALTLAFIGCSQGVVEDNTPQKKATDVKTQTNPHGDNPHATNPHATNPHADKPKKAERKVSIPKEIADKYKSVILEVKNIQDKKDLQTEVIIGQQADLAGTPYKILVEFYIPDFVIDSGGVITTRSAEEKNPVAKIKIFKEAAVYFDGWLYKNFPGEHGSFTDPKYSVTLIKSVLK